MLTSFAVKREGGIRMRGIPAGPKAGEQTGEGQEQRGEGERNGVHQGDVEEERSDEGSHKRGGDYSRGDPDQNRQHTVPEDKGLISLPVAPKAMRTAISRRRFTTEYATTP